MREKRGRGSRPDGTPASTERGKRSWRRIRKVAYVAPAIVSSFFITPASAAPQSGCQPSQVPCHPFS